MGPAWTDVLRFACGTRLQFSPLLPPALREAMFLARPSLRDAWAGLDQTVLTVLAVSPDGCALSAGTGADATRRGEFSAAPGASGGSRVRVQWTSASESLVRDVDGIALMLGGDDDVYLAQRVGADVRLLSRWQYDRDGSAVVSVYPATFASRLHAAVRAALPTELRIGVLRPVSALGISLSPPPPPAVAFYR